MSGTTRASIVGVKRWTSPQPRLDGIRERKVQLVQETQRVVSHRDDQLRLDDVQLAREHRARLLRLLSGELEAVRAVDRERVDVQALQRLDDRLAGAPVERHALLRLRRLRPVLEQEDVRHRVPGADHGEAGLAGGVAISSPSSLISVIAFWRYRSKISSVDTGDTARSDFGSI